MPATTLTPERWRITEDVLVAALDASPDEREALLAERCAGDAALLADVRALIEAQQQADNWVASPVPDGGTGLNIAPEEALDRRAGPYRLERLIGRGGMGAVFLAHRADGEFTQKVAIKLIGLPFELEPFRERFRQERQILAGLNHPNITRLLDGGVTPEGELYLAMEYVEGVPLDEFCRQKELAEADRLRLFRSVCGAVQYAHQNLIVHRDIKPSNVLVASDGVPKLLDFGTAKLLTGEPGLDDSTRTGMGLMTAAYASPEQLRGEPASTLSDVYSLGVLLYELLSGHRAFGNDILARVEAHPTPHLPKEPGRDLDRIVSKALEPEAARRYPSVEQLSEDVRRYQDGEPVLAHPPGLVYRGSKFVRRHAWSVALATIFVIALACLTAFSLWQTRAARRQADRAERINAFLNDMLGSPNPSWYNTLRSKGKNVTVLEVINELQGRVGKELTGQPGVEIELRRTLGRMYGALGQHGDARVQLEIALQKQITLTGRNNPSVGRLYKDLAAENILARRFPEAVDYANAALAILGNSNNRADRATVSEIYEFLASGLYNMGRPLAEAESAARRGVALSRVVFGTGGPTALNLSALSSVLLAEGKFEDARAAASQSLALHRARPGPLATEALEPLLTLGGICIEREDYACAEKYLRESFETGQSGWGSDNIFVLNARVKLALTTGLLGRTNDAERELRICIQKYRGFGVAGFALSAPAYQFMSQFQMAAGDLDAAEASLREAVAGYRQHFGEDGPATEQAGGMLGECLLARNKRDEALPLLIKSYRGLLNQLGPNHPWTIRAKQRLAKAG